MGQHDAATSIKPQWFHILLALADRDLHGYAIMTEVNERTDGHVRLWPATLYGALKKLERFGLIEEVEDPGGFEDDERERRFYGLTEAGRDALAQEARRMAEYVDLARSRAVIEAR